MFWLAGFVSSHTTADAASFTPAQWSVFTSGKFHLILDLAVGGWSCDFGECEPSTAPAPSYTMYVQWVKWLQLPS